MEFGLFELKGRIGEGGMGEVWKAVHQLHDLSVAVKVITDQYATDPDYRRRFKNEVRSVASLNHPGIVRILDYGEATEEEAAKSRYIFRPGSPYLVMELADGGSLHGFESELDWPAVRGILIGLLEALGHAHARGIIHRDLKPSNVLLTEHPSAGEPTLKLTDFGLAFTAERAIQDSDEFDDAAGTPFYMAPEQFRSRWRDFGPWTDLYGLGCLTWRILTGEHPFSGRSLLAVARSHLSEPLPAFEPDIAVPDELEGWLARLLEKHPNDRYRSAADALWALLRMPAAGNPDESLTLYSHDRPVPTVTRTRITEPLESALDNATPGVESTSFQGPLGTRELGDEDSVDRTIEPAKRKRPPVPDRWQQTEHEGPSMNLVGAGRQLYNLRDFPMVGRHDERDALWDALLEVEQTGDARVVFLKGPAGVGKSRLARWIRERAEEIGTATGHMATHSVESGPSDGLPPMLARMTATDGLDRDDALRRTQSWCRARGVDDDYEWIALTELLERRTDRADEGEEEPPGDDLLADDPADEAQATDEGVTFSANEEIRALIGRFLGYASTERPLVVHLDDLQWGRRTLQFLEYFYKTGQHVGLPVLFVGTLRDDLLAEHPEAADIVDKLADRNEARTLKIGPMSPTDQRFLAEELLRLTPAAASRVIDRTGGNPLFAVELVRDWIERDILEVTDQGFDLVDNAQVTVPDTLQSIWTSRLDQLLDGADEPVRQSLQLAATLGRDIDVDEWRTACRIVGLPFPDELLDRLQRRNLLQPTDSGWRFAHNMLRDVLTNRARASGNWVSFNRICGRMLQKRSDEEPAPERLARYLIRGEQHAAALEPLMDTIDEHGRRGDVARAEQLFKKAEKSFAESELSDASPSHARMKLLEGRLTLSRQVDLDLAEEQLEECRQLCVEHGHRTIEIDALLGLSRVHLWRGNESRAIDNAKEAYSRLEKDDPSEFVAHTTHHYAQALAQFGRLEAAEVHFREGVDLATTKATKVKLLNQWGSLLNHQNELGRAREKLREAESQLGRNCSPRQRALLSNLFGDCERRAGNLSQAASHYRTAEEAAALARAPSLYPCWLGRVQVALEQRKFELAKKRLERARTETRPSLHRSFDFHLMYMSAQTDAGLGEFTRLEVTVDQIASQLEEHAFFIPDVAESLTATTEILLDSDEAELAKDFGRLAIKAWEKLDRGCRVAELEEQLEASNERSV